MEECILTYEDIEKAVKKIAYSLKNKGGNVKRLVSVSRGGMLPACLLAYHLEIREIHSLALYSYRSDGTQGDITVLVKPDVSDAPDTLFVDDLSDTGKTAEWINKNYPKSCFISIFSKNKSNKCFVEPTKIDKNKVVFFPWEVKK